MSQSMTGLSRRTVLTATGLSLLVAGIGLAPIAAADSPVFKRSDFATLLGRQLTVSQTATVLTLVAVEDIVGAPTGDERAFSLIFEPAAGPGVAQGIYTLVHDENGWELFLAPVGPAANTQYQVVVNQLSYTPTGVPL